MFADKGAIVRDFPEAGQQPELLARLPLALHASFFGPDLAQDLLAKVEAIRAETRKEAASEKPSACVGIASHEPLPPYALTPMSDTVHRAFIASTHIQDELEQSETRPLHVMAALLEDQSCKPAQVFRDAGITREKIAAFLKAEK